MHDLVAAQDIVKTAIQIAKKNKLKKISRIVVRLGNIEAHGEVISPENLQFNFELVKKNTLASNATLVISKGSGKTLVITEVEGEK